MAKVNFRQQKRQRELVRKQRQDERMRRRGEAPVADEGSALVAPGPRPASGPT